MKQKIRKKKEEQEGTLFQSTVNSFHKCSIVSMQMCKGNVCSAVCKWENNLMSSPGGGAGLRLELVGPKGRGLVALATLIPPSSLGCAG